MNKIQIFMFGFLDLVKGRERDVVCKLFALLYFIFLGAAPMHTLCTGGHFEPAPSLTTKYYRT